MDLNNWDNKIYTNMIHVFSIMNGCIRTTGYNIGFGHALLNNIEGQLTVEPNLRTS